MDDHASIDDLIAHVRALRLPPERQKALLQRLVAETWPNSSPDTALNVPAIREFREASVAACVVPVFKDDDDVYKAVVGIPSEHYHEQERGITDGMKVEYAAFGGYLDLEKTPGTSLIPPRAGKAEDPQTGAIRGLEAGLSNDKGKPVLARIDPRRLVPMDAKTITRTNGERCAVVGFMLKLEPHEVEAIKAHIGRMSDFNYHHAVREHVKGNTAQKPPVVAPAILPVGELARSGEGAALLSGQHNLFENIAAALSQEEHNANAHRRQTLLQRLEQYSSPRRRSLVTSR